MIPKIIMINVIKRLAKKLETEPQNIIVHVPDYIEAEMLYQLLGDEWTFYTAYGKRNLREGYNEEFLYIHFYQKATQTWRLLKDQHVPVFGASIWTVDRFKKEITALMKEEGNPILSIM